MVQNGEKLTQIVKEAQNDYLGRIILVKINGKLSEIRDMEITDEEIEFVTTDTSLGNEVYKKKCIVYDVKSNP